MSQGTLLILVLANNWIYSMFKYDKLIFRGSTTMEKEKPIKTVAIVRAIDGTCKFVAEVKTVTQSEYKELLEQQRLNEKNNEDSINNIKEKVEDIEDNVIPNIKSDIALLKGEDHEEETID